MKRGVLIARARLTPAVAPRLRLACVCQHRDHFERRTHLYLEEFAPPDLRPGAPADRGRGPGEFCVDCFLDGHAVALDRRESR